MLSPLLYTHYNVQDQENQSERPFGLIFIGFPSIRRREDGRSGSPRMVILDREPVKIV